MFDQDARRQVGPLLAEEEIGAVEVEGGALSERIALAKVGAIGVGGRRPAQRFEVRRLGVPGLDGDGGASSASAIRSALRLALGLG